MPVTDELAAGRPGARPQLRRWLADLAWLPGEGVRSGVLIEAAGERITAVTAGTSQADCPAGTARLPGLTMPGLANSHSHAFHRALRGACQTGQGTFWTWRERMYQVAGRLDPGSYLALAQAVYAEMALAGITCVGEFHYLHHGPRGVPYDDPNAMSRALVEAAARAGVRITLLDTCYLAGGLTPGGPPEPLAGVQQRFGDRDGDGWAGRVDALGADEHGVLAPHARAGVAIHSVRAVPPGQMRPVIAWSHAHGAPLHAHLSEQPAENQTCLAALGVTPAEVLERAGALGPRSTMVHATHLTAGDIELLGSSRTVVCLCPTTEADLADGIGPARALASAGCPLSLGSDSHAVIDVLEEARRVELGERLASGQRGNFAAADLAQAATVAGHACLGWPDAGLLAPGALADLVTLSLDTPRLAGASPDTVLESVIFAGTGADVRHVVAGGVDVVADGRHLLLPDVPAALAAAIRPLLE
ncbi:MAG TPA: formimidoylglutamate deiminase [Streptosporangiaceae bacterium]